MDLKEKIRLYSNSIGIDCIGFLSCRRFEELSGIFNKRKETGQENEFEEREIERRINPFIYMADGETIISFAFPYNYKINNPKEIFFSRYTLGRDYHWIVSFYLKKIAGFIEDLGGKALCFSDNNTLPERYIASLSGIGFIGNNNMLITEKYGSYVFLGEIITNLKIEPNKSLNKACGDCNKCYEACPTKSINKTCNNPNICLAYITQKKIIEDSWLTKLDGRLFGCDSCQEVCPYNLAAQYSKINEFTPLDFMLEPKLEELLYMDNKMFKDKYSKTSAGWRGKNIIIRNALLNYLNIHDKGDIILDDITSPYIKDYYYRLLTIL